MFLDAARLVIGESRVVPPNEESADLLRAKHPASTEIHPTPSYSTASIVLSARRLTEAVKSMSAASAPGPDGLRASHLQQFLSENASTARDTVVNAMRDFSEICTSGRVPASITPLFYGASLCALRKSDGSLRPIAVGFVLRRLISKAICGELRERAAALLLPSQ